MKKRYRLPVILLVLALVLLLAGGTYHYTVSRARAEQQAAERAAASEAALEAERQAAEQAAAEKAATEKAAAEKAAEEAKQAEAEALAAKQAAEAQATREQVQYGDCIGKVWVEGTEVNCDLYWGDSSSIFHAGAGCSADNGCVKPGEAGTVFVGGHTDTYFVDLKSVEVGDIIHLDTTWGDYQYKVTELKKISETDTDQCRWGADEPSCILYTCYPFGIQTPTIYRWLVYADPVVDAE
ncbi:MAG: class D sortase [Gemmiger sp.]|nr:class D sortase [Gemmiger sp.]